MIETAQSETPFLSVIIPVYNRERLVLRALASVFADDGKDFEIIVVDDGSADGTADRVANVHDTRLQLVRLAQNGGRCPARNRGAALAKGEWLVFLDSDDELVPGGLDVIRQRAKNADAGVAKLLFGCRDDAGVISPRPPLDGRTVDYTGYLRWLEETIANEALPCTRRQAFAECPYPEQRYSWEGIHELDFVKREQLQLCPDIVRLYHYDAPDRVMLPDPSVVIARAGGEAEYSEAVLSRHGAAMQQFAPARWTIFTREAALFNFLAGDRRKGAQYSFSVLRRAPASVRTWVVLMAGLLGPGPLRRLWSIRRISTAT